MKSKKSIFLKVGVLLLVSLLMLGVVACSSNKDKTENVELPEITEPAQTEPPHIHRYVENGSLEPTCTTAGYTKTICECGDEKQEDIPALEHDYKAVITDATCTEAGYTTYTCSRCNDSFVDDEVEALGHDVKNETTVAKATCLKDGRKEGTCSRCNAKIETKLPALDHNFILKEEGAPGCNNTGYKRYVCSRCCDIYIDVVERVEHDLEIVVKAPTCLEAGYTTKTCKSYDCNYSVITDRTPALGHFYVVTENVAPTCEEIGHELFECSQCDAEYTNYIRLLGHDYEDVVTAPTCTTKGYTTHTCKRDGCAKVVVDTETDVLPHDCRLNVVEPTCTEAGYSIYLCKDCDYTFVSQHIPAYGHNYETVTVLPDCVNDGYVKTFCTHNLCEDITIETLAALGHDYKDTIYAPDCENIGYTSHDCVREGCGHSYADTKVDALGHDYDAVVTEPTCTHKGYTTHTCQREDCTSIYIDEEVEALPHNCDVSVVEPTCDGVGFTIYECKDCDFISNDNYKEALGHDYVDGICQREECGHVEAALPAEKED